MAESTSVQTRQMKFVEGDDVHGTTVAMLEQALDYCSQKAHLAGRQAAAAQIAAGNPTAVSYFHYSLARQIGEYLGNLDQDVKAAYIFDYDATPEDVCFGEVGRPLVHMVVRVERKTAALAALVTTLDRALAAQMAAVLNTQAQDYVLDVQPVDDAEVASRTGYGALLSSLQHAPLQVWGR